MRWSDSTRVTPLLLLAVSMCAVAQQGERAQLDSLRSKIRETVSEKQSLKADQDQTLQDLKKHELELADTSKRLQEIRLAIRVQNARLQEFSQRNSAESSTLDAQRQWLATVVRAHYSTGRDSVLKLLLKQDDPQQLQRLLVYHDIFTRARIQSVAAAAKALSDTRLITENIRLESERLGTLEADQATTLRDFERLRAARAQTLVAIRKQITRKDAALDTLRSSKRSLEKLLYSLPATPTQSTTAAVPGVGIATLKGRLAWPVRGRIETPFNSPNSDATGVRQHGVFIQAAIGSPVKAIGSGQIRFADWFQGFGLLVIIDHGAGYLSLYGHNQTVSVKVGDTVKGSNVIATVGDSGGQRQSGLYFAIRHQGDSLDPSDWCR